MQEPPPLRPVALRCFPAGAVRPRGWLRGQLETQARGLGGRIESVWEDLGPSSGWRGGAGESWERGPYDLEGLVPLAHALGDRGLLDRADGSFGPSPPATRWGPDWWYLTPVMKALLQHAEASGDRVPGGLRAAARAGG